MRRSNITPSSYRAWARLFWWKCLRHWSGSANFPLLGIRFQKIMRRCLLKRFPYGVIYHLDEQEILVIAIAHLHRKPEFWRNRLPE